MTEQAQRNQAYLQWYFRMHEPQANREIRRQEIVPMPGRTVYTNPWVFAGPANLNRRTGK
jgi:hypothetical protein